MVYQIKVEGHLGSQWTDWFDGLTIRWTEDGNTLFIGLVVDQATLHGFLKSARPGNIIGFRRSPGTR